MSEPRSDSSTMHLAVAAEVRAHLARQRISGRQAAFALGWKQPYIARRLSGEIPFDVTDLAKLADLLGLPITAFFDAPASAYATRIASHSYRKQDIKESILADNSILCTPMRRGEAGLAA